MFMHLQEIYKFKKYIKYTMYYFILHITRYIHVQNIQGKNTDRVGSVF